MTALQETTTDQDTPPRPPEPGEPIEADISALPVLTLMPNTDGANLARLYPDMVIFLTNGPLADFNPTAFHQGVRRSIEALALERTRFVQFEMPAPEEQRKMLLHIMKSENLLCELPVRQGAKFSRCPARSSTKRRRMINKTLKAWRAMHLPGAVDARRSALIYELLEELIIDQQGTMREKIRALKDRHELIVFMRCAGIRRSVFSDEVMNAGWLSISEQKRALKNHRWYHRQKLTRAR